MKNSLKLYAVNYCEKSTLKEIEGIRTHSLRKATLHAEYLKKQDYVFYAQVVTYEYDENNEYYIFADLHNLYK